MAQRSIQGIILMALGCSKKCMFEEPKDLFEEGGVPANLPVGGGVPPSVPAPTMPTAPPAAAPVRAVPAPAPAPASQTPMMVAPTPPPTMKAMRPQGSGAGKIVLVVIAVLVILGVAAALTYILLTRKPAESIEATDPEAVLEEEEVAAPISKPQPVVKPTPEATPIVVDSDGDGLSDAQEIEIGTDPDEVDTDNDELGDREEVVVYGTNPLEEDTDGDGYPDGSEVRNGYNPNGSGRLFQVPQQ